MKELEEAELHPNVGAYAFQYAHKTSDGALQRREFHIKFGDDPNRWVAERMMPGAECTGQITAVYEGDGAAVSNDAEYKVCVVHKGSKFEFSLFAKTYEEFLDARNSIGLLSNYGIMEFDWAAKLIYMLKWYWLRRPTIKRKSPLDVFDMI